MSLLRLQGTAMKLFLVRSKRPNEDKEPRSLSRAPSNRLQSLIHQHIFKEHRPDKEGSGNPSVGDERKDKTRFLDLDSPALHPANDNT